MSPYLHPSRGRVLIVDAEASIRVLLAQLLRKEGYEPLEAACGEEALTVIQHESLDALLLETRMPGLDGMAVLRKAKELDPDLPAIVISTLGLAQDAVAALHAGAQDYLVKPFDNREVLRSLDGAVTNRRLHRANRLLFNRTSEGATVHEMMGTSEVITRIYARVARVADSAFTVLITGETGTGKEIVARAIHEGSPRSHGPFVGVDCGAIPESLFESELFGHEKGAFTGAERCKPGKFENAMGGTLFLDEIPNMPLGSQAKLLRALQERTIYRIGGSNPIEIDARVLVSANEDLEAATAKGTFRRDLFFRLNEFGIRVPPLRERKEDILFLAKRFLDLTNRELAKGVAGLSGRAVEQLLAFHWPGNVRQLRSTMRRAVLLADTVIDVEHLGLSEEPRQRREPWACVGAESGIPLRHLVSRATVTVERAALLQALKKTGWNKSWAARLLQIDNKTMHSKLKRYGLKRTEGEDDEGTES
jgi:two-component system nitrogen regulation response regulator GlnG